MRAYVHACLPACACLPVCAWVLACVHARVCVHVSGRGRVRVRACPPPPPPLHACVHADISTVVGQCLASRTVAQQIVIYRSAQQGLILLVICF